MFILKDKFKITFFIFSICLKLNLTADQCLSGNIKCNEEFQSFLKRDLIENSLSTDEDSITIEGNSNNVTEEIQMDNDLDYGDHDILVFTVATNRTEGLERYLDSAKHYNIKPVILGLGEKWKGGDMNYPGGGFKVNLLKNAVEQYKDSKDKILLFTDAYDVMFLSELKEIYKRFKAANAGVLFAAEVYCWPDTSLESEYPPVAEGKQFLNSGMFIGYAPQLWQVLNHMEIKDLDDDQLFYTKAYLNKDLREKIKFKLDHTSSIFFNLNGATNEIEIVEVKQKEGPETYVVKHTHYKTNPLLIHGNGNSKTTLNYLSNYLLAAWNSVDGCIKCKEGHIDLLKKKTEEYPSVLIAIFVELATPFLEEQLRKIYQQEYPKDKLHLFIHNNIKYHTPHIKEFIEQHGQEYASVKEVVPQDSIIEWLARDISLDYCLKVNCDMYFSIDSIAHIDNPHTIRLLIEQNRTVVAPMLARPGKAWSNFWGALTKDGYYARSIDYMDIVHNERRGLWNVPFVGNCYMINGTLLRKYDREQINYRGEEIDADMAFCQHLRDLGIFMYVSNRVDFGHLINPETYDITRAEPEMYQIFENTLDWEDRFLHPDYKENFNPDKTPAQPCPDVYWFPIVTRRFCQSLINMMENFGQWSDGSNHDTRLEGGYEAVPTRDIHMKQVGWERHWLYFLKEYVGPLQERVFIGYSDPASAIMNFVVRYKPDEQPSLRPHHDSSTYTINIALNERGIDYEGGGCRFIRYNCSVVDTKPGWLLMHPGRLTHYHEGLLVTKDCEKSSLCNMQKEVTDNCIS